LQSKVTQFVSLLGKFKDFSLLSSITFESIGL